MAERILVLTTSYPRGPGDHAGHFIESEAIELARQGNQVTVFCPGNPEEKVSQIPSSDGGGTPQVKYFGGGILFGHPGALPRLKGAPWRLLGMLQATRRLRQLVMGHNFDRIVAHWLLPTAFPWATQLFSATIPLEVVIHGSDLRLLLRAPEIVIRRLLLHLYRRKVQLRFVSESLKKELSHIALPSPLRSYVEQSQVRASPIRVPAGISYKKARNLLGLNHHDRWGVIVGRLIAPKRISVALNAAALVPGLSVAVIGAGPLKAKLEKNHPKVRFLGQLERTLALQWIAAADLLLTPSLLEGAPTVVREARALNTPVVCSNSGEVFHWAKSDPDLWVLTHSEGEEPPSRSNTR